MLILGAYDKWTYNNDTLQTSYNETMNSEFDFPADNSTMVTTRNSTLIQQVITETTTEEIFCPYTPFMLAFVILLLKWVFVIAPLFCCGSLMGCMGFSMRKMMKNGDLNPDFHETLVDDHC